MRGSLQLMSHQTYAVICFCLAPEGLIQLLHVLDLCLNNSHGYSSVVSPA